MASSEIDSKALQNCITRTDVPSYPDPYRGKVRDVYSLGDNKLAIVASDRISAFDHIMKQAIPYKGQILNSLAAFAFNKVDDLVATHVIDVPHQNVTIAKKCKPIPIEVVIRACLTGHAARVYKSGKRKLCGVDMPDGMVENQQFEKPILTPATKAEEGHDEDISERDILDQGIVDPDIWEEVREKAFQVFNRGQQIANDHGLILVDTKYEFGLHNGEVTLMDEVHTADCTRAGGGRAVQHRRRSHLRDLRDQPHRIRLDSGNVQRRLRQLHLRSGEPRQLQRRVRGRDGLARHQPRQARQAPARRGFLQRVGVSAGDLREHRV